MRKVLILAAALSAVVVGSVAGTEPPKPSAQDALVVTMAAHDWDKGYGTLAGSGTVTISFAGGLAGATGTRRAQQFYLAWDSTTPPTLAFFGPSAHADTTNWIPYGAASLSLGILADSVQVTAPTAGCNYSWWANTVRVPD